MNEKRYHDYWRSLDELADTPQWREFAENEFPHLDMDRLPPTSRRHFLKLIGSSVSLAGLVGCRWPREEIVPFADRPETRTPGVPQRYATVMEVGGVAAGLLVTSYDGRPIKIEGNPGHPISRGATDAFAQAAILEIYDPGRGKRVLLHEQGQCRPSDWAAFEQWAGEHFKTLRKEQGQGLRILSEASSSPSLKRMREKFLEACPQASWVEYEPVGLDNERAGLKMAFGQSLRPVLRLDQAEVIVSFDADILAMHPAALKYARDWAAGRTADDGKMNRLYVAEPGHTLTGALADERKAVPSGQIPQLVASLAGALGVIPGLDQDADPFIARVADDLKHHRGAGVVMAGANQPVEVHILCHAINERLGNIDHAIVYIDEPDADRPSYAEAIRTLTDEMADGQVKTLLILGGNPVYDAPVDVKFPAALAQVETTIHLSLYQNETSQACAWYLPRAHFLEAWGDGRAYDGTLCTQQPLIAPLYEGRAPIELLSLLIDEKPVGGYEIVRTTWQDFLPRGDFEKAWRQVLHDGVLTGSASATQSPWLETDFADKVVDQIVFKDHHDRSDGLELNFRPDYCVYDGRFAGSGWLQEMPEPMTKITWDNAVLMSAADSERLKLTTDDKVLLEIHSRRLEAVVYVMPGQSPGAVTLTLGYGRTAAGPAGNGVGFNAYELRTSFAMGYTAGLSVTRQPGAHRLACTQNHHAIDRIGMKGKEDRLPVLVREGALSQYRDAPHFVEEISHHPPLKSLWKEHEYEGHRWAMAIDLTRCTGCGACTVACQSENNVPVVGRDEVLMGREMHWLRVDRYFKGDIHQPRVVHQPIPCMQCELAPCEQVCPVAATVHSSEGLNDMVYNRCIGTRYCSNNCPFKVRRFNYFNNQRHMKDEANAVLKMAKNPEVTVRSRGVMEKCTYCVQRIMAGRIQAKNERRPVADGEIVPACGQVCPTQAIVFGDLSDENSAVARLRRHNRAYAMLAELNIKPRTQYLAKLRNPPAGTEESESHGGGHH